MLLYLPNIIPSKTASIEITILLNQKWRVQLMPGKRKYNNMFLDRR